MNEALLAELHPPRLPEAFAAPGVDDVIFAFGLGMLLAAVLLVLLAPVLHRRPRRVRLAQRIGATRDLPPDERLLALARLMRERGVALPDDQRAAIYAGLADPEVVEQFLARAGSHRSAGSGLPGRSSAKPRHLPAPSQPSHPR